ncbi:hypothetical protein D3C87_1531310 [compost metagenome]
MLGEVDHQVAVLEDLALALGVAGLAAAQQGLDAGDQLAEAEGLDQVVVGADLEADDAVDLLALGGEHDDGDVVLLAAQKAADLEAAQLGQHEVQNDQVGLRELDLLEGLLPIVGLYDLVALLHESELDGLDDHLFVVDKQNLLGHCHSFASA